MYLEYRNGESHHLSEDVFGFVTPFQFQNGTPQSPKSSASLRELPRSPGQTKLHDSFTPPASKFNKGPRAGSTAEIAPWETSNPTECINGRSQKPSLYRPGAEHAGISDNYDPMFMTNNRRPSTTSTTTESSQSSAVKGNHNRAYGHKATATYADGRQSSIGSETSAFTGARDETSSSHSRRNNSIQHSNDSECPVSPSSSRPRTPLASSEITPWLFQEFKVRRTPNLSRGTQSIHIGLCKSINGGWIQTRPLRHVSTMIR